jgi:hypothetical protein
MVSDAFVGDAVMMGFVRAEGTGRIPPGKTHTGRKVSGGIEPTRRWRVFGAREPDEGTDRASIAGTTLSTTSWTSAVNECGPRRSVHDGTPSPTARGKHGPARKP